MSKANFKGQARKISLLFQSRSDSHFSSCFASLTTVKHRNMTSKLTAEEIMCLNTASKCPE